MAYEHSKRPSATKRGPGRYHSAGHEKSTPAKSKGAPRGFVLHNASPARKERRALVKLRGRRQALKAIKFWRDQERYAQQIEADERAAYVPLDV